MNLAFRGKPSCELAVGEWETRGDPPLAHAIRGRKVGLLGLGGIGQNIACKLAMFGCEIVYHGRSKQSGLPERGPGTSA